MASLTGGPELDDGTMQHILAQREQARSNSDSATADALREQPRRQSPAGSFAGDFQSRSESNASAIQMEKQQHDYADVLLGGSFACGP